MYLIKNLLCNLAMPLFNKYLLKSKSKSIFMILVKM